MQGDKPQPIYLIARWNGNRLVYPTRFNVIPKHWNAKGHKVRDVIAEVNKDIVNATLADLKSEISTFYANSLRDRTPLTIELLRERLNDYTGRNDRPERHFWGFLDGFIASADKKIVSSGKLTGKRTIQAYKTFQKTIKEFEKESGRRIDFNSINSDFYNDFSEYLIQVKEYKLNTVGKHIALLKKFINEAVAAGIDIPNINQALKALKPLSEQSFAVYLTEKELNILSKFDLSKNHRLEKVRDLFLFGCFTGLRVSDYNNIKPHHIKSDTIEIYQTKTGRKVIIPILPETATILAKYGGNTPPRISDQKLNQYIKELCELAGFTGEIEVVGTKAGKRVSKIVKKFELITTHSARRTFASNSYKKGIPPHVIMAITGHKTEATFLKYIKLSQEEHATQFKNSWNSLATS